MNFLGQPGNTPQAFFAIGRSVMSLGVCDEEELIKLISVGKAADEVRSTVRLCKAAGILVEVPEGIQVHESWQPGLADSATPVDFSMVMAKQLSPESELAPLFRLVLGFLRSDDGVGKQQSWSEFLKQEFNQREDWPITDNPEQIKSALRWLGFLGVARFIENHAIPDFSVWMARWIARDKVERADVMPFSQWWADVGESFPVLQELDVKAPGAQLAFAVLERRGLVEFTEESDSIEDNVTIGDFGFEMISRPINAVKHLVGVRR